MCFFCFSHQGGSSAAFPHYINPFTLTFYLYFIMSDNTNVTFAIQQLVAESHNEEVLALTEELGLSLLSVTYQDSDN